MVLRRRKKKKIQEDFQPGLQPEPITAILRLDLLRTYKLSWLPGDVIAGLVIFAVTVPTALAYGQLAGLQAVNGLYASLLAMGVYAFFGTSRQLIIGAEAAVAIIVFSSVASVAAGADPARFAALVMMEAILVGGIQLIAGLTRVGFIADFIPRSVVIGFLNGMALIIIMAQAGKITGIELSHADFIARVLELYGKIHGAHQLTLKIAGACLLGLLVCRLLFKFIPGAVAVAGLATAAVIWWNLGAHGVQLVGQIPAGLPHPWLPPVGFEDIVKLFPIAMGVALISFVDTAITARAFAMRGGYQLDHNQELIALGLTNVGAGVCQGFAVGASHSRTAVNVTYHGRSQLAGLIAAGLMTVFLLYFTHILKNVPVVALAAIIVAAGISLLRPKEVFRIWRTRPASAYVSIITTFAVLIAGLMIGILVAVAFAIILVLHRLARPHETVLRPKVPGSGLLVYRFAGPLFFFNAAYFFNRVQKIVEAADPPINFFLINAEAIVDIDINAGEILEELYHYLRRRNIILGICEAKGHFRRELLNTRLTTRTGFNLYPNVASVVRELSKEPAKEDSKSNNTFDDQVPSS
jgi:sulfate permease, SulP family